MRCGASWGPAQAAARGGAARDPLPGRLAQPKDRTLAYTDVKSAKAEENVLRLLFSDQKLIAGAGPAAGVVFRACAA